MNEVGEITALLDGLTDKQREVLVLVSEGLTSKEIARRLGISVSAVNQRIEVVRQRLGGLRRSQIGRIYRKTSTVVITIPTSNPLTGRSVQLLSQVNRDEQDSAEGAGVQAATKAVRHHPGSHPSANQLRLHHIDTALVRLAVIVGIAIGLLVAVLLVVTVFHTLADWPGATR